MAIIYGMADSERQLLNRLPGEVKNIDDIDRVKKHFEKKLKKKDTGFFAGIRKWNYKRQINKFENNKDNPLHAGTCGENKVIEELLQLNDNYHVFCGVKIRLPYYVTYNGQKNLKSAQMDVVVVCPKGVFMIEVKNWSDNYVQNNNSLNPYEQTERAGRILWIALQKVVKNTRVTNVLLSIQGNMSYNKQYRTVLVTSLNGIIPFLKKRESTLSIRDGKKIVDSLKHYVTK